LIADFNYQLLSIFIKKVASRKGDIVAFLVLGFFFVAIIARICVEADRVVPNHHQRFAVLPILDRVPHLKIF